MKRSLLFLAALASSVVSGVAQNYQPQYPYDPYNTAPTPQQYQEYQAPAQQPTYSGGSGDYAKQGYGSGSSSAMTSSGGGRYAELLSWGHLEAHYAYNDFRGDDKLDGDSGFGVNLRVKLMKPIYLHLGLDRITATGPNAQDLEITTASLGGGVYVPLGERVHLYGEVGLRYDWTGGDLEYINTDDASLFVRPGIRVAVTEDLELTGSVLLYDTDNLNEYIIEVSAYYALLDWLDLGGGVDIGSDYNTYRIGGRWRW